MRTGGLTLDSMRSASSPNRPISTEKFRSLKNKKHRLLVEVMHVVYDNSVKLVEGQRESWVVQKDKNNDSGWGDIMGLLSWETF